MELRQAVTMQREFVSMVPENTKFFHPLPRDARHPTLPFWLDNTELNGWDQQSQNGYFTRIVLLGMLGGHFGDDFQVEANANARVAPESPVLRASADIAPLEPPLLALSSRRSS